MDIRELKVGDLVHVKRSSLGKAHQESPVWCPVVGVADAGVYVQRPWTTRRTNVVLIRHEEVLEVEVH